MKFRSKYSNDSSNFRSNPGKHIIDEYGLVTSDDGITTVDVVGQKNLDAIIQSNKDNGNIALLVARYNAGDTSALNKAHGVFGDFRNMPTTYAEMVSRLNECRVVFEGLPVEIKEQFENNPDVFWSEFGSEKFNKVFEDFNDVFEPIVENPVSADPIVENPVSADPTVVNKADSTIVNKKEV